MKCFCPKCNRVYDQESGKCPHDGAVLTPDPLLGRVVDGRYVLAGRLGEGGFGVVYRAEQLQPGPDVAVKVIRATVDDENMARFWREVKVLTHLRHPNIISMHGSGQLEEGAPYYVMEIVGGPSLKSEIKRGGQLPVDRVVTIARQICFALSEIHGKGLIHRDLKPGNVHICPQAGYPDFVKVLDMGLAKDFSGEATQLTQTGSVIGSIAYMSPEQVAGHQLDPRTDLYSLGIIIYEMLCGVPPFRGAIATVLHAHMLTEPPPMGDLRGDLPVPLVELVERLLQKKPGQRPAGSAEVRHLLENLEQPEPKEETVRYAPVPPVEQKSGEELAEGFEEVTGTAEVVSLTQTPEVLPVPRPDSGGEPGFLPDSGAVFLPGRVEPWKALGGIIAVLLVLIGAYLALRHGEPTVLPDVEMTGAERPDSSIATPAGPGRAGADTRLRQDVRGDRLADGGAVRVDVFEPTPDVRPEADVHTAGPDVREVVEIVDVAAADVRADTATDASSEPDLRQRDVRLADIVKKRDVKRRPPPPRRPDVKRPSPPKPDLKIQPEPDAADTTPPVGGVSGTDASGLRHESQNLP